MSIVALLLSLTVLPATLNATPFIVQSLSSRYALVLGGYGRGYQELREVDVVKHNAVCQGVISPVPSDHRRYLGDLSGMAEYIDGDAVLFCRWSACWALQLGPNTWRRVAGFLTERDRAASAAVGDTMVVLGGRAGDGEDIIGFEVFNVDTEQWEAKEEWEMAKGRYSFCAVPYNHTALLVVGGYTKKGAIASVELLDTKTGRWEKLQDLPKPRYGHSCLMMELAGRPGVLVSGGALTGDEVDFYDLVKKRWEPFPSLPYRTDGHKMVLVEGIPTLFSWERTLQFDGSQWIDKPHMRLSASRSAFAVTTVPGHLVPGCL